MCLSKTLQKSLAAKSINPEVVSEVADRFAEISEAIALMEKELAPLKAKLIAAGQTILLPEREKKVLFLEGAEMSAISVAGVYNDLFEQQRLEDFMAVASISEASLKKIDGGEVLAAKYKTKTGQKKADTVSLRDMTKAEVLESRKI